MKIPIKIWRWRNTPKKYQKLYKDDVDWVAFVPDDIMAEEREYISFLEEGTPFAICCTEWIKVELGWVVFGCHS